MIIPQANRLKNVSEYYFSKKLAAIKQLEATGHQVINLGIGSPDLPPSERTIKALSESANSNHHHGYQSYRGTNELREAIAEFYKETYHTFLNPTNEILPLIGSKEGIMHISMAFLNEGDKVLIPNPGYPTYTSVTSLVGAEPIYYDITEQNNWQMDLNQLKSLPLNEVKILWLNTPHMPTGAELSKDILFELVYLAKKNSFLICCDNPYSMLLTKTPTSILQIDGAKDVVLELNSLSKSHNMAGWRVGWVAGKKEYIDAVMKVKSNMDSGMLLPVQHAAVAALKNSEAWHNKRNEIYSKRKQKAYDLFDLLNCSYNTNQVGLFVWAKVSDTIDDIEKWIDELIKKAGVFITPGFIFGSNGSRYVRVSLCSDEKTFDKAINQIKKVI